MAKFMFSVSTGYVKSVIEEEIEIDDSVFNGVKENSLEYYKIIDKYYIESEE
ncbi:hypothetical protein MKX31_27460 [Bacillus sp. FSL M8-0063]|uniref:DUF7167 family protein n=1 Tax=Bacillus TaxID=1386 RepID=UPI0015CF3974|nr:MULTISPECIES: hypothetical protein [Bacillus]MBY7113322.1 hypothetical protein [Bacillus sp. 17RED48]